MSEVPCPVREVFRFKGGYRPYEQNTLSYERGLLSYELGPLPSERDSLSL